MPSLNLLCHSKTHARFIQDAPKALWSIAYVFVAFFPSLKHNFIAYRSSKVSSRPDCIFEIHQQWQSGFSRVYSNSCCSCSFEPEIIKIGQLFDNKYSNNIVNFQESTIIFVQKSLETYWIHHVNALIYKTGEKFYDLYFIIISLKKFWLDDVIWLNNISIFVGYIMSSPVYTFLSE